MTNPSLNLRSLLAAAALVAAAAGGRLAAQEPPVLANAYLNDAASFYLNVKLNHASGEYAAGEFLSMEVVSERDAYLYVQYQQADGTVFQIFPNPVQPDNRVTGGQAVKIPGGDDLFRWEIGPPYGPETIKVIASTTPIEELAAEDLRDERFNRVETTTVGKAAADLARSDAAGWAETDVALVTSERRAAPTTGRRVGLFFGISKYTYSSEFEVVYGEGASMDLAVGHADALALAEAFEQHGALDEARAVIDGDANRANMEYLITQWLPSVTSPGDTVFISYSGHGGTLPDDNGDEPDSLDETLCPADYMTPDVALSLLQRAEKGEITLTDDDQARLGRLVNYYREADAAGRDGTAVMQRAAQITDDAFGRWLQRLAGRHVVVILDSCHSGGFAQNKSLTRRGATFDFLDGEMVRMKDIGYEGHAMISAAAADEYAWENAEDGLSVLSLMLHDYMTSGPAPATLRDVFTFCEVRMKEYFDERERIQREQGAEPQPPSRPQLADYGRSNVVFKP